MFNIQEGIALKEGFMRQTLEFLISKYYKSVFAAAYSICGIVLAVLALVLKLIITDMTLPVYLIIAAAGLASGIIGIFAGLRGGRKAAVVLGITAVVLSLALGGVAYYSAQSRIWDTSRYTAYIK